MTSVHRSSVLAFAFAFASAAVLFGSSLEAQNATHTVRISNQSDYEIFQVYLSPSDVDEWGFDRLGSRVLGTDQVFSMHQIRPDRYDVKLVDEDGDTCVRQLIVRGDMTWTITDASLIGCELRSL